MHVQPRLAQIVVLTVVTGAVVLVTDLAVVIMPVMVMVTIMHVILVAVRVGVNERPRECADRCGIGHAEGWRQCKHGRHRPDEGNAASACSFQSRQHWLRTLVLHEGLSQHGISKA